MVLSAVIVLAFAIVSMILYKPKDQEALGWDIVVFAKSGLGWIILGATFIAGFIWEFRRAR